MISDAGNINRRYEDACCGVPGVQIPGGPAGWVDQNGPGLSFPLFGLK